MTRETKAAARAINTILWRDWDPIGCGVPEDEYETYVWPLYRLLIEGKPRAEIEAYLEETARDTIGIAASPQRIRDAAEKLMGLNLAKELPA